MDVGPLWATLIDRMQGDDRQRLSWSVRHDRTSELDAERLEDLLELSREACAIEFPNTDGYVTSIRRLSGALEGASIRITRGRFDGGRDDFSALISIQRYTRTQDPSTAEIRVVASYRHRARRLVNESAGTALSRWSMAGCAVGTMGVGVAGLELSGLLVSWGQALVLIPAFLVWRVCMAVRMATTFRARAREPIAEDPAIASSHARDRKRWRRVTDVLLAQRDAMGERTAMRPFRSQGAHRCRRGVRPPQVLAPAVVPVPALPI
jgi:hypothetical protein